MHSPMPNSETVAVRVFLVESDPLRVVGFRTLLEPQDIQVQAGSLDQIGSGASDVVVLSAHSPGDVFEMLARLQVGNIARRALVVGPKADDELMLQAVSAGAKGYVEESAAGKTVAEAIRVVHSGSIWAPRRVLASYVERESSSLRQKASFTEREKMVLRLLVAGRTNKEIGQELHIEERTVKAHVGKLLRKVGVQNRIALSVHAVTRALLQ